MSRTSPAGATAVISGDADDREANVPAFDVETVRDEFPILRQEVRGKPLVYLDNAATTQKPLAVVDAIRDYYLRDNANVHRGVHLLSERATKAYEGARDKVRRFLNAGDRKEIVFTSGCTEAINLVAESYGRAHVAAGDEVLVTTIEHHSNIVPWQRLCESTGAHLRVAPIDDRGELILEEFERLLSPKTRMVAIVHASNALGTINPLRRIIESAHRQGVPVLVDGAQSAPHLSVDVRELDCDFYAFSGHKIYGPTGIGVLYGKQALLDAMPPYQSGGEMIRSVTFEGTVYNDLPFKFEAGTPNIAGAVGLGAALDYVDALGLSAIGAHEEDLLAYATEAVETVPGLRVYGTARAKVGVLSFTLEDIHPHDIGTVLDGEGVAVRTGHHCAQPVMDRFGVPATVRASFGIYNTRADVDRLIQSLHKVRKVFG